MLAQITPSDVKYFTGENPRKTLFQPPASFMRRLRHAMQENTKDAYRVFASSDQRIVTPRAGFSFLVGSDQQVLFVAT